MLLAAVVLDVFVPRGYSLRVGCSGGSGIWDKVVTRVCVGIMLSLRGGAQGGFEILGTVNLAVVVVAGLGTAGVEFVAKARFEVRRGTCTKTLVVTNSLIVILMFLFSIFLMVGIPDTM